MKIYGFTIRYYYSGDNQFSVAHQTKFYCKRSKASRKMLKRVARLRAHRYRINSYSITTHKLS